MVVDENHNVYEICTCLLLTFCGSTLLNVVIHKTPSFPSCHKNLYFLGEGDPFLVPSRGGGRGGGWFGLLHGRGSA